MLERLSEKFAGKLINAGIISEADADVYMYGFFQTIMMLLNVVTTILLGILFKLMFPCILLNLSYIPLRVNAGGHHAESPMKCYVNSTVMIAVLLAVIKWIPFNSYISCILLAIAGIVIWKLTPVETENNPLDEMEKTVYRKRTQIVLIIEIIVFFVAIFFMKIWVSETIALGVFTECLMLLVGAVKNHYSNDKI